jgi:N-acetylglucosaminyldiphosphoundecaprenol N-acetyl-beta-D-mannosaminyltransferase
MPPTPQPPAILGIPVSAAPLAALRRQFREWLTESGPHQIITINPEMLVAAARNPDRHRLLMQADERIIDGAGILLAARILGQRLAARTTGVELMDELAAAASSVGRSVYLLGADPLVARSAAAALQHRHPALRIAGADEGVPKVNDERFRSLEPEQSEAAVIERIRAAKPGVLFVAYGHPKQDQFIADHKRELAASVQLGVGGAFDFLAGRVWRAPRLIRALWLEWFWRLIVQPWRIGRIWNATVVFLWLVARERMTARTS